MLTEEQKQKLRSAGYSEVKISAFEAQRSVRETTESQFGENAQLLKQQGGLSKLLDYPIDVNVGIAKGVLSTLKGAGELTARGLSNLPGKVGDYFEGGIEESKRIDETGVLEAQGTVEKLGKGAEQIAEFFIPGGVATKAKKAVDALKIVKAGKVGAKSLIGATELGGVSAIQSGELGKETGLSAGIGLISPILGAGIKALKPVVAPVIEFTSGVPKGAIKRAMTGSDAVKAGMKMTTEEVRNKAVEAYKVLDTELKSGFSKGLEELSKLSPRIKPARTAKVGGTSVFSGVKGEFKKILEGAKESIPQAFRDLRISVKGGKLDFDKLNSSIVNASERKQIQQVWDTIRN